MSALHTCGGCKAAPFGSAGVSQGVSEADCGIRLNHKVDSKSQSDLA